MPALAKTTDATVIEAARGIVERCGLDGLSMQSVAVAVNVTAPALYKRYADRASLVRAVQRDGCARLSEALAQEEAVAAGVTFASLARRYRMFAKANPNLYAAMYHDVHPIEAIDVDARRSAAAPLFALLTSAPERDRLNLARTFTAFVHGFVQMENSGAFKLGGNVDEAFTYGIDLLQRAFETRGATKSRRPHPIRK